MRKSEERALEAYPKYTAENLDKVMRARHAFVVGYEQAEKDLGWHSVNESLPPIGEEVIALTDVLHGKHIYSARYICFAHIVDRRYAVDYNGWNIDGVKYWMSCPNLDSLK